MKDMMDKKHKSKMDVLSELMDMGDSTEGREIGEGIKIVIEAKSKEEAQQALDMAQEKVDSMPEDSEEMEDMMEKGEEMAEDAEEDMEKSEYAKEDSDDEEDKKKKPFGLS